MNDIRDDILARVRSFPGDVSFCFKNLVTGDSLSHRAGAPHTAASVIKLAVMAEAFRRFEAEPSLKGRLLPLQDADRVPICGVLTLMHSGLEVSLMDLVWLMITISDNMATNMLIDFLGIEAIQGTAEALGLEGTALRRKLFESRPELSALRNTVTAGDMARLLEGLWRGQVLSPEASRGMLEVLLAQQLNGKIPARLPLDYPAAHKTGEDDGISHDVGIVYAAQPFVVCFLGSGIHAPDWNALMGEVTEQLAQLCGGAREG